MRPYNDKYYTDLLERLPRNLATGYEAAAALEELLQTCARLNEYRENANTACGKWEARAKMLEQENKRLQSLVDDMPPAMTGNWEWFDEEHGTPIDGWDREWGWRCSVCKDTLDDEYDDPDKPPKHKYCPKCGARMDKEE